MAKGEQRSNKLTKKPKKDSGPSKPLGSDRPVAPITVVPVRGKLKNK
jgi:hypothetical protein